MRPVVAAVTIYPIKALDGLARESAVVNPSGSIEGDRCFAMLDANDAFINGKRYPSVNCIRARYAADLATVTLGRTGHEEETEFELDVRNPHLARWLSDALGVTARLEFDANQGFPDSSGSPGPTLVSRSSLEQVAAWFPDLSMTEVRRRFRTNIEIAGVPAFWEDGLAERSARFCIGSACWQATKRCNRCAVPTQDTRTGAINRKFQKRFMTERRTSLPPATPAYVLAIKTRAVNGGGRVAVGDILHE